MKITAVIPAFNEEQRIRSVAADTLPHVDELVVVDDGSGDNTAQAAAAVDPKIVSVRHIVNLGKGAAMKTGFDVAVSRGADIIVVLDADGQHLPEEIPVLTQPLLRTEADVAFGCRDIITSSSMPLVAKLGNRFLTAATRLMFRVNVRDTQSGFRAMTAGAYKAIRWDSSNYAVETEMIVRVGRSRLRSVEVPISTIYHDKYKGTTIIDGIRIFSNILFWRLKP